MFPEWEFLKQEYFGNSVENYLTAFLIFLGGMIALVLLEKLILHRLKNFVKETETTIDETILKIFEKTILPVLYVGAFYYATHYLTLADQITKLLQVLFVVVLMIQSTRLAASVVALLLERFWLKEDSRGQPDTPSRTIIVTTRASSASADATQNT